MGAGSIITDTQLSPSMQLSKLGIVDIIIPIFLHDYCHTFSLISIILVPHQGKHDTFSCPLDSIFLKCLTMNALMIKAQQIMLLSVLI